MGLQCEGCCSGGSDCVRVRSSARARVHEPLAPRSGRSDRMFCSRSFRVRSGRSTGANWAPRGVARVLELLIDKWLLRPRSLCGHDCCVIIVYYYYLPTIPLMRFLQASRRDRAPYGVLRSAALVVASAAEAAADTVHRSLSVSGSPAPAPAP
jgi:hypothetical protein